MGTDTQISLYLYNKGYYILFHLQETPSKNYYRVIQPYFMSILLKLKYTKNCNFSCIKKNLWPLFRQVTWPTFPPEEVNLLETVLLPESVSLLVSGKEAKTTDAWEFPPAPHTLTSLSPKRKHKPKRLDQNKQAARAEDSDARAAYTMPSSGFWWRHGATPNKKNVNFYINLQKGRQMMFDCVL